jgi:hypothetical protein
VFWQTKEKRDEMRRELAHITSRMSSGLLLNSTANFWSSKKTVCASLNNCDTPRGSSKQIVVVMS